MTYNWIKISNGDWKCTLPNGDLLRVERMNREWVWWCFYSNGVQSACYDYPNKFVKTIKDAKILVQECYGKRLN